MAEFLSFMYFNRKLVLQFLLVIFAFFIMVVIGSSFGAAIVNKNVDSYGDEVIRASAETIEAFLNEIAMMVNAISFSVEKVHNRGGSIEELRQELESWNDWLEINPMWLNKSFSIHAATHGIFISGARWIPPDNYDPQSRPWNTGVRARNGDVFFTDPFIDTETGRSIVTISKMAFDENDIPFGVVGMDLLTSDIAGFINNMQFLGSGFGILLDSQRRFFVHPHDDYIGRHFGSLHDGRGGILELVDLMAAEQSVSAFPYTMYTGEDGMIFLRALFNGWYVGIISPRDVYFNDVRTMRFILSLAGVILTISLCVVLALMHIRMHRSDEASKIKSAFLANMSHEIRTPMNAIIGMSEFLQYEQLSARQMAYVNDINSSAHSLLTIINDILDMSKIESGKMNLVPVNYNFSIFLDNIKSVYKYMAQKKGLKFKYEASGEIPEYLYGDDIRLRQILTNLCGNAVKFTENGYVRMKVIAANEMLAFEINDSGRGIRKDEIQKIFNAFEQVDTKKNRNAIGVGLGLSISKTFAEMMGGKIKVDSEHGHGATFTVEIPMVKGSGVKQENETDKFEDQVMSAPAAKILVVDDNEFNIKTAEALLSLFNISAKLAYSGPEAINLVQKENFDIVFMDHMMPDMDGVEAAQEIRKLGEKYSQLAIIALTANAVQGAKEMFLANGFDDYISKPIEMRGLKKILMEWLPAEKVKLAEQKNGHLEPDMEFQKELQSLFAKSNQQKFEEITKALEEGDIKLAHRLTHTLKSNAGQLGKTRLQQAAMNVEYRLKDGTNLATNEQLQILKTELEMVLDDYAPLLDKSGPKETQAEVLQEKPDAQSVNELIKELEPLLKMGNPDCRKLIDRLRRIPDSEKLIQQIADFDFELALVTLTELKNGNN